MKFSQLVHEVIRLSQAVRDYYDRESPKYHPDYPLVNEGEEDTPPPPQAEELRRLLAALPEGDLYRLYVLSQVCWSRVKLDDVPGSSRRLRQEEDDPKRLVRRMSRHTIGGELEDGLLILAEKGIDVDALFPAEAA